MDRKCTSSGEPKFPSSNKRNLDEGMDIDPDGLLKKRIRQEVDVQGLPPEMVEALNNQLEKLDIAVSSSLLKHKPQGQQNLAWASEFKTERLFIAVPLTGVNVDGSMLDQVILALVQAAPTRVTLTPGQSCESVPQLSQEDERFMVGILSAVNARETPRTLKCGGSSITDNTFYSVWNLAAARLVNDKERRGNLHPCILPEKPIHGSKASEYLSQRLQGLKSTLGLNYSHIADTIERLVKIWTEENSERTRAILSNIKIPWSFVLSKGAEFKVSKKKQGRKEVTLRQLVTPLNPKESAWVMPNERKIISHLCAPIWGRIDAYQKEWAKLRGADTQALLESYINKVRLAYKEMHRVSESMTKRLGQRKTVILNSPTIRKVSKKELKSKKTNDLIVIFSKSDLKTLPKGAKAIFEPFYTGQCLPCVEAVMQRMTDTNDVHTLASQRVSVLASVSEDEKRAVSWELQWFDTFGPDPNYSRQNDIPKDVLAAGNMFEALTDMESG
jgi:hypothetical protein